jgi:hypothetical protein
LLINLQTFLRQRPPSLTYSSHSTKNFVFEPASVIDAQRFIRIYIWLTTNTEFRAGHLERFFQSCHGKVAMLCVPFFFFFEEVSLHLTLHDGYYV